MLISDLKQRKENLKAKLLSPVEHTDEEDIAMKVAIKYLRDLGSMRR
jgi:hypothetical protein